MREIDGSGSQTTSGGYDRNTTRIASSEEAEVLFGDTSKYRRLLSA